MKITTLLTLTAIAVISIGLSKTFTSNNMTLSSKESTTNNAAVMTAYNNFYTALNALFIGDTKQMLEVWSHSDDVMYMGPDNVFLKGWEEVSADWKKQAAKKLGGKVTPKGMSMIVGQDMAITNNYEIGENIDANGNPIKVSIRATNTFRKENGQWKMVGHHTDLLSFLVSK